MAKASTSVLKLVRTVHRIGKKIRKPTSQAAIVDDRARCVVDRRAPWISGLQVPADDADEEEGDDVGEDDGDDAARRGAADVELKQRLGIDQEGDVGGLQARAAAGGDEDLGEHRRAGRSSRSGSRP